MPYTDSHTYPNSDCNGNRDANGNSEPYPDTNGNADGYNHAETESDPEAASHARTAPLKGEQLIGIAHGRKPRSSRPVLILRIMVFGALRPVVSLTGLLKGN